MLVCVVPSCLFRVALWSPAGKGLTSWLLCLLCFVTFPNVSWSTSELRARLAPWNWFRPSSKIFYWPFQSCTSFVDLLCFCSALCSLCLCARPFICALWPPAGKGLTSWLSFVVSAVSLLLSHWYPGSDVVLDCIDSWSLHPYLLLYSCWHVTVCVLCRFFWCIGFVCDCGISWP